MDARARPNRRRKRSSRDADTDSAASAGTAARPDGADRPGALSDDVLAQARAGDDAAFTALYLGLQPGLHRYAAALVGQDADDVTAEAWLHIARDLRNFRGEMNDFRAWTARIVRNRAMDLLRYRARRPVQSTATDAVLDRVSSDDTESAALEHLSTAQANELIAALPRDQAEAVMLRAVIGLDARSAGKILGKSPTAVRVSAHRGLRRLATKLAAARARQADDDES